jgi:hypothetical protein
MHVATIPAELSNICTRCLEKSQTNRYESVAELKTTLTAIVDRLASSQSR